MLEGGGPPDVVEVTLALAREMLALAGIDDDPAAALATGAAWIAGGGWCAPRGRPGRAPAGRPLVEEVRADADGVVAGIDALAVGVAAWRLGAGRARKEDPVSAGGRRGAAGGPGRRA